MTYYPRICTECGDLFVPTAAPLGFCSDKCKSATEVRIALTSWTCAHCKKRYPQTSAPYAKLPATKVPFCAHPCFHAWANGRP